MVNARTPSATTAKGEHAHINKRILTKISVAKHKGDVNMFGGFESVEAFKEAWGECPKYMLPINWEHLNILVTMKQMTYTTLQRALSKLPGTGRFVYDVAEDDEPLVLTKKYAKCTTLSLPTEDAKRRIKEVRIANWFVFVSLAHVLECQPDELVDELAYYQTYSHVRDVVGFKRYSLWFACWRKGFKPEDLLQPGSLWDDYAISRASPEARRVYVFDNLFRIAHKPNSTTSQQVRKQYSAVINDKHLLDAAIGKQSTTSIAPANLYWDRALLKLCTILDLDPRSMFISLKKYEVGRTPLWMLIDMLPRLTTVDMLTLYALIELISSETLSPEEQVQAIQTIVLEKKPQWEALCNARSD